MSRDLTAYELALYAAILRLGMAPAPNSTKPEKANALGASEKESVNGN